MDAVSRRVFLQRTGAVCVAAAGPLAAAQTIGARKRWRAAIIGHTGAGDYGHGLDVVFEGVPHVEVVGVADPDEQGRAGAAQRTKAERHYADYREMLEKERPELVSIAPRWSQEHHAMAMAALKVNAHLISEKPFTTTLAEADEVLALAEPKKLKIAVAHQMRLAPSIIHLRRAVADGLLGELLAIRSWGKQDARAGGEDMLVLGTHVFDMMRFFAGDALWCTATVRHKGADITRADARKVAEQIGPVAGDEIDAQFGFANGVHASFTSRGKLRQSLGHWGMELLGSKAMVRIFMDVFPTVLMLKSSPHKPAGKSDEWVPVPGDPTPNLSAEERGFPTANRRLVDDWLDAIATNRQPQCSGRDAMKAIEMVMAVYHAALQKQRVALPLRDRAHPLM